MTSTQIHRSTPSGTHCVGSSHVVSCSLVPFGRLLFVWRSGACHRAQGHIYIDTTSVLTFVSRVAYVRDFQTDGWLRSSYGLSRPLSGCITLTSYPWVAGCFVWRAGACRCAQSHQPARRRWLPFERSQRSVRSAAGWLHRGVDVCSGRNPESGERDACQNERVNPNRRCPFGKAAS